MSTIHVCTDISGSMQGKKLEDAKSIASLIKGTKEYYTFNDDITECKESEFNQVEVSGGTNIVKALHYMFDRVFDGRLTLITDCEDSISPNDVEELKNKYKLLKVVFKATAYVHVIGDNDDYQCQEQLKEIFGEDNVSRSTPESFREDAEERAELSNQYMNVNETAIQANEQIMKLEQKSQTQTFERMTFQISTQTKQAKEVNKEVAEIDKECKEIEVKQVEISKKSIQFSNLVEKISRALPSEKIKMKKEVTELQKEAETEKANTDNLLSKLRPLTFKIKKVIAMLGQSSNELKKAKIAGNSQAKEISNKLINAMKEFNNDSVMDDKSDEKMNCFSSVDNAIQSCGTFIENSDKTNESLQVQISMATQNAIKTLEHVKEQEDDLKKFQKELIKALDVFEKFLTGLPSYC